MLSRDGRRAEERREAGRKRAQYNANGKRLCVFDDEASHMGEITHSRQEQGRVQ